MVNLQPLLFSGHLKSQPSVNPPQKPPESSEDKTSELSPENDADALELIPLPMAKSVFFDPFVVKCLPDVSDAHIREVFTAIHQFPKQLLKPIQQAGYAIVSASSVLEGEQAEGLAPSATLDEYKNYLGRAHSNPSLIFLADEPRSQNCTRAITTHELGHAYAFLNNLIQQHWIKNAYLHDVHQLEKNIQKYPPSEGDGNLLNRLIPVVTEGDAWQFRKKLFRAEREAKESAGKTSLLRKPCLHPAEKLMAIYKQMQALIDTLLSELPPSLIPSTLKHPEPDSLKACTTILKSKLDFVSKESETLSIALCRLASIDHTKKLHEVIADSIAWHCPSGGVYNGENDPNFIPTYFPTMTNSIQKKLFQPSWFSRAKTYWSS